MRQLHRSLNQYHGNHYMRSFSCVGKFLYMPFAQLSYRQILQDIEARLRAVQALGLDDNCRLTPLCRLISAPRSSAPRFAFGFVKSAVAVCTLAVRLTLPPSQARRGLAPPIRRALPGAQYKKATRKRVALGNFSEYSPQSTYPFSERKRLSGNNNSHLARDLGQHPPPQKNPAICIGSESPQSQVKVISNLPPTALSISLHPKVQSAPQPQKELHKPCFKHKDVTEGGKF